MLSVEREIKYRLRVLNHAKESGNVSKTCRYFGISRQWLYTWKKRYETHGEHGLVPLKRGPIRAKNLTPKHIEEKVLYLRRKYHFGTLVI